jgi:hypothetical protein
MSRRIERMEKLFDLAAFNADGFTIDDAAAALGCSTQQVRTAVSDLRSFLADDSINLVCEPGRHLEQWIYRLVGNFDDARGWTANRIGDAEARLLTLKAVATSVMAGTDGRTLEGKRAKVMVKALGRLVEDLGEIGEDN